MTLDTVPSSPAFGHIDLLTVVMHELGHVMGIEDIAAEAPSSDLMSAVLATSARRTETEASNTAMLQDAKAILGYSFNDLLKKRSLGLLRRKDTGYSYDVLLQEQL